MLEAVAIWKTQVTFRTGDGAPAEAALQLQKLGALISWMCRTFTFHIEAIADPRGTEAFNHGLSWEQADRWP